MVPFYEIQRSDIKVIHNKRELNYPTHVHEHMEILYVFDLSQHINIDGIDYEINAEKPQLFFRTPFTLITGKFTVTPMKSAFCFFPVYLKGYFRIFPTYNPKFL